LLVELIQEAKGPMDAAALLARARERDARIDRATVYRTLDLLRRLHLIGWKGELDVLRFAVERQPDETEIATDHIHLTCLSCGRIQKLASPPIDRLRAEVAGRQGFEITLIRLEFGGMCKTCRGHGPQAGR
jgi:Fe2+ or Zn2+ uptake regulation protein